MASTSYEQVKPVLTGLGGLWALYQAYKLASFVQLHFLRGSTLSKYKKPTKGKRGLAWALVTGATDGIGKGFAQELCAQGFNVVIHGRNEAKLERVRRDLTQTWPSSQVRTLRIDAGKESGDPTAFFRAAEELKDIDLKVIINNVGGSGGLPSFSRLHERTSDHVQAFMDINARFPTEITRTLLPQLQRDGPALILNVGSVTSELGIPYLSVYSGCKGYNKAWSASLNAEMKADSHDVEVMCIMVGAVATDYTPKPVTVFVPNARQMARHALHKVGCGRPIVYGHWGHHFQVAVLQVLPAWLVERFVIDTGKKEKQDDEARAKTN